MSCNSIKFFRWQPGYLHHYSKFFNRFASLVKYCIQNSPKLKILNIPIDGQLMVLPIDLFEENPDRFEHLHINFTVRQGFGQYRPFYDTDVMQETTKERNSDLCQLENCFPHGKQTIVSCPLLSTSLLTQTYVFDWAQHFSRLRKIQMTMTVLGYKVYLTRISFVLT